MKETRYQVRCEECGIVRFDANEEFEDYKVALYFSGVHDGQEHDTEFNVSTPEVVLVET